MKISPDKLIDEVVQEMGHDSTFIGNAEREAIRSAIEAGAQYGFGNMMAWLSTAWAQTHVESGMPVKTALLSVHGAPYPLPHRPLVPQS